MNGKQDIIDFLIEKGYDEKVKDKSGLTPVQYSQMTGIFKYEKSPLIKLENLLMVQYKFLNVIGPNSKLSYSFSKFCDFISSLQMPESDLHDIKDLYVNLENYYLPNITIGKGQDYCVFLGKRKQNSLTDEENNKYVSVKVIKYENNYQQQFIQLLKESIILHKLNHPAIFKIIGLNSFPKWRPDILEPILVYEYLPNKTLEYQLTFGVADSNWNSTKKYIILLGISHAMKYAHQQGIIHSNLNTKNIQLDEDLYPKITNFRYLDNNQQQQQNDLIYTAPEIFNEKKFGFSVDVYSFAMIAYYVVTSNEPFSDLRHRHSSLYFIKCIMNGFRPALNDDINIAMRELLSSCWSMNDEERPTFDQIFDFLASNYECFSEDMDKNEIDSYIEKLNNYTNL